MQGENIIIRIDNAPYESPLWVTLMEWFDEHKTYYHQTYYMKTWDKKGNIYIWEDIWFKKRTL